jgi:alpha-amylase
MKNTVKKVLSLTLVLAMLLAQILTAGPLQLKAEAVSAVSSLKTADTDVQNGTTLHCWNWSYENIIKLLPTIAAQGFTAIQVSPIQQAKQPTLGGPGTDWWAYYQPLDFKIDNSGVNALGTKSEFMNLCETAHDYGIYVIVDVVTNQMAGEGKNRNPGIPADILYDDSCWHNRSSNIWD